MKNDDVSPFQLRLLQGLSLVVLAGLLWAWLGTEGEGSGVLEPEAETSQVEANLDGELRLEGSLPVGVGSKRGAQDVDRNAVFPGHVEDESQAADEVEHSFALFVQAYQQANASKGRSARKILILEYLACEHQGCSSYLPDWIEQSAVEDMWPVGFLLRAISDGLVLTPDCRKQVVGVIASKLELQGEKRLVEGVVLSNWLQCLLRLVTWEEAGYVEQLLDGPYRSIALRDFRWIDDEQLLLALVSYLYELPQWEAGALASSLAQSRKGAVLASLQSAAVDNSLSYESRCMVWAGLVSYVDDADELNVLNSAFDSALDLTSQVMIIQAAFTRLGRQMFLDEHENYLQVISGYLADLPPDGVGVKGLQWQMNELVQSWPEPEE